MNRSEYHKDLRILKLFMILLIITIFTPILCFSQKEYFYKQIDTTRLTIEFHFPEKMNKTKKYPVMVFFYGGGWIGGDISQFIHHANYFSKRGLVCALVDYRTEKKNHTTPFESLKDAKSAIRFIKENALDIGIDPQKIIACGGSAGGQLALATAVIEGYNEDTDNLSVSCVPNALVLYNPVIDNGPEGFGFNRIGSAYLNFSPLHNIKGKVPPTIFFVGTKDKHIPVQTAEYFRDEMIKFGNRCELRIYEGAEHGFFNFRENQNNDNYKSTLLETDKFLQSLGYLKKKPHVPIK